MNRSENGSEFDKFVGSHLNPIHKQFRGMLTYLTSVADWNKISGEAFAEFSTNAFISNNVWPNRGIDTICDQLLVQKMSTTTSYKIFFDEFIFLFHLFLRLFV